MNLFNILKIYISLNSQANLVMKVKILKNRINSLNKILWMIRKKLIWKKIKIKNKWITLQILIKIWMIENKINKNLIIENLNNDNNRNRNKYN